MSKKIVLLMVLTIILIVPNTLGLDVVDVDVENASTARLYYQTGSSSTWDVAHDADNATNGPYTEFELTIRENSGVGIWIISRVYIPVNTSFLGDNTIYNITYHFWPSYVIAQDNDDQAYLALVETTAGDTVDKTDYSRCGDIDDPTIYSEEKAISEIVDDAWNYIQLTNFSVINTSGMTYFGVREGHDIEDDPITATQQNRVDWEKNTSAMSFFRITYGPPVYEPRWSDNSTNDTTAGATIEFSLLWNSSDPGGSNMSSYIFYFYNGANTTELSTSSDLESGTQSFSGELVAAEGMSLFDDFESDFSGNWTDAYTNGNPFSNTDDWTRDSGGTPSGGTGPSSGADGTTWYVYVETSSGSCYAAGEDAAVWMSDTINWDDGTDDQIHFYYHMYGSNIGELILEENSTGSWVELWSETGDQGNSWYDNTTDLSGLTGTGNLRIWYECAGGYTGDAAVDEINVTSVGNPGAESDANKTAVEYTDVVSNNFYEIIDNITATVYVSYYNTSGSTETGNTNTTIYAEIYNGSSWIEIGDLDITGTGNFSITTTDSTILSAWQTEGNRDIRLYARYMDYNDSGHFDTINWTDVWINVNHQQKFIADDPVEFTDAMCDIPKELCWSNVTKTITDVESATIEFYWWANTSQPKTNTSDIFSFITATSLFIDIIPSQALSDGINFDSEDPGTDDNAANNNTACDTGTCYNISIDPATTVNIDLYHCATDDLSDDGSTIEIENVTHQGNQSSSTGSNLVASGSTEITTSYASIVDCSNVPDTNTCYIRFWLDVPSGQTPGSYSTTYKYCAVENGAGTGECS